MNDPQNKSTLPKLIAELCPDGVEFKKLGEIGTFTRGNGLQKKDFTDSGVPCIHYGQIYTYYGNFTEETKSFVSPECAKNLRKAKKGDLIITTTSENLEDVCKCLVWLGEGEVCIGGETSIFSHNQNPKYIAYCLQTASFFDFKKKNFTGTKVIRVHQDRLKEYKVPVPPMEVQREIVRILDKFTELGALLEKELVARKKQYEYYREKLLTFGEDVPIAKLGEIGTFYGGLAGKNKDDFRDGNAKYITYMNVYSNFAINLNDEARVKVAENENQHAIKYGDVLFTGSSETPDECGMSSVVTQKFEEKIYLNSFCFGFRLNDVDTFCPDFLKHLFRSDDLRKQIFRTASGVTRYNVSKKRFADVKIPVPTLDVQCKIARSLDNFTELIAQIELEIAARKKQYEYYRDRLLTFREKISS